RADEVEPELVPARLEPPRDFQPDDVRARDELEAEGWEGRAAGDQAEEAVRSRVHTHDEHDRAPGALPGLLHRRDPRRELRGRLRRALLVEDGADRDLRARVERAVDARAADAQPALERRVGTFLSVEVDPALVEHRVGVALRRTVDAPVLGVRGLAAARDLAAARAANLHL